MKEGTESNVKFKKLKRRLQLAEWQAIGLLEAIWKLTRNSCPAGDIGKFSNEDIAASIEWGGDADELVECLVACGWLDEDDEFRLIVHDWSDHVPTYLKGNFSTHKKQFANDIAKQRAKQVTKQVTKQLTNEGAKQGATKPSQSEPSQVNPNQANIFCSEPKNPASEPKEPDEPKSEEPPEEPEPPFDPESCEFPVFPCSGDVKTWEATERQVKRWAEAYPAVEPNAAMRRAHAWIMANLSRRKTAKGMKRFVNAWLAKEQDRPAGINGVSVSRDPTRAWNGEKLNF